jgi:hypothetical protein
MYLPGCACSCASCARGHVLIGRRSSLVDSLDAQEKDPAENDLGTDVECRIPGNLTRREQEGPTCRLERGVFAQSSSSVLSAVGESAKGQEMGYSKGPSAHPLKSTTLLTSENKAHLGIN